MKKIFVTLCLATLLAGCSGSDSYADKMISLYEDTAEEYENAQTLQELDECRRHMQEQQQEIRRNEQEGRKALTDSIKRLNKDAYRKYLDILYAESYAQWIYTKRQHELK